MSTPKRKICYENLFEQFKTSAQQWLDETPEARTLFLVVDWAVGKNDFPAIHVVTNEEPTEQAVLDSMGQALKMLNALAEIHSRQVAAASSTLRQAQALIEKMQQAEQGPAQPPQT